MLDSVGCGELPDAAVYGDEGSDTLGNIAKQVPLDLPRLRALGLDRVSAIGVAPAGDPCKGGWTYALVHTAGWLKRLRERIP